MIHYCCDLCKRPLDPQEDLRYVVKMEVFAAFDPLAIEDEDRDNLQELQDILEMESDEDSDRIGEDVYQHLRFDLCADCRKKFIKNPLGKRPAEEFDFSKN